MYKYLSDAELVLNDINEAGMMPWYDEMSVWFSAVNTEDVMEVL